MLQNNIKFGQFWQRISMSATSHLTLSQFFDLFLICWYKHNTFQAVLGLVSSNQKYCLSVRQPPSSTAGHCTIFEHYYKLWWGQQWVFTVRNTSAWVNTLPQTARSPRIYHPDRFEENCILDSMKFNQLTYGCLLCPVANHDFLLNILIEFILVQKEKKHAAKSTLFYTTKWCFKHFQGATQVRKCILWWGGGADWRLPGPSLSFRWAFALQVCSILGWMNPTMI